jgi:c-di-GMP-binding flagellar brake protein YcgR
MEPGSFLIVSMPPQLEVQKKIYTDKSVVCRYVYLGRIYAFQSRILSYILRPSKMIILSYPESAEIHDLRSSPRVECRIPAEISYMETSLTGIIADISRGGCRFVSRAGSSNGETPVSRGDLVDLRFVPAGNSHPETVGSSVKHIKRTSKTIEMGLEFTEMSDSAQRKIDQFIENLLLFV